MFDYIIVGAGSAGCVLANRLSANPHVTVCLLEAGPTGKHPMIHMPTGIPQVIKHSQLNWHYDTEPQINLNNRKLYWPRGKVLGGSSSMNAMVYIRGHQWDYDHWAELGNPGWSYQDVLPYFKKAENYEPGASAYHGVGGPLNVADLRCHNELSDVFIEAMESKGYPRNTDFNGATQEGAGLYQVTQVGGQRCGSARAYLKPIKDRPNLKIITDAQVTQLTFEGKRVRGVKYIQDGSLMPELKANREIILCGGAINSPQLLLLSGIGDPVELAQQQIKVVHGLPGVGKNLQDHLDVLLVNKSLKAITMCLSWGALPGLAKAMAEYVFFKQGILTTNVAEGGAFIKSDVSQPIPDLQIHFVPGYALDHGRKLPKFGMHAFSMHVCQLRPKSRGYIGLETNNPLAAPLIQPNYLTAEEDLTTLVKATKIGREILSAAAFGDYVGEELYPGKTRQSDEQLVDFIRERAETIYHPVGTCKMGQDNMAVVDHRLKVHGIEGLRVVDASIMPTLIGGNTNAPSIMIAEKAADMILTEA